MSRPELATLDRLTTGLPEAAAAVARAAQRLADSLGQPPHRCPWCCEAAGWCDQTGGPNPCEGHVDAAALLVDAHDATQIHIRLSGGTHVAQ